MSEATTLTMPKRPTKPKPVEPEDGYFLVRLPAEYRRLLGAIRAITKRSITQETQIALELRAKAVGAKFTPNYPESIL